LGATPAERAQIWIFTIAIESAALSQSMQPGGATAACAYQERNAAGRERAARGEPSEYQAVRDN
jgi:hypothetical protein